MEHKVGDRWRHRTWPVGTPDAAVGKVENGVVTWAEPCGTFVLAIAARNLTEALGWRMTSCACPDCGVKPDEKHERGCDVERCALCGRQALSCACVYEVNGIAVETMAATHPVVFREGPTEEMLDVYDARVEGIGGRLQWTGEWPGTIECREFGWWVRWNSSAGWPNAPGVWVRCKETDEGAIPDGTRLILETRWDTKLRRYVRPDDGRPWWTWEGDVCGGRRVHVEVEHGHVGIYAADDGAPLGEPERMAAVSFALQAAVAELRGTRPPGTTVDTISRTWWPPKPLTDDQEQALVSEGWRKGEGGAWHQGAREPGEVVASAGVARMVGVTGASRLSIGDARFVVNHLLRPGESEAARPTRSHQPTEEQRLADIEPWEGFLSARFAAYQQLVETFPENMPVGWLRAAVRVFADDAGRTIKGFDRRDWPGDEEAERALVAWSAQAEAS